MGSHEIDYEIFGDDMQTVEIGLDSGETIIAEAGAMNWMDPAITFEAQMGDGTTTHQKLRSKFATAGKRILTRESLFLTHFTNGGSSKKKIAFAAPYPGKIIPIDLSQHDELLCQKDAFLCAAFGTQIGVAFNKRLGVGFFGGEGFILQRLKGDGYAFIHAGGAVVKKELNNETLLADTGCLIAFTPGITYNIQKAGNLKSMVFAGEGLFLAKLEGTGSVYLQTMPFLRFAKRVVQKGC